MIHHIISPGLNKLTSAVPSAHTKSRFWRYTSYRSYCYFCC